MITKYILYYFIFFETSINIYIIIFIDEFEDECKIIVFIFLLSTKNGQKDVYQKV